MLRLPLLLIALLIALPAHAQQFWKKSALLADMFPTSERIEGTLLVLDEATSTAFEARIGYAPPRPEYTFYVATTADQIDGYVLFDDQIGQHEPITFAVQLTPEAVVVRQEVVVYRENYGAEIRHPRFRKQFVGKTSADPLVAGDDISIVSGATYSCKSMSVGVRRAIALTELLMAERGQLAATSPAATAAPE